MAIIRKRESIPSPFQRKTCWLALTGISGAVVVALVIGFFWIAGIILGYLQQVLLPIAIAGIIAYLLEPIVSWLERRRLNRTLSVSLVLTAFLCLFGLSLWKAIPPLVEEANAMVQDKEKFRRAGALLDDVLNHPILDKAIDHYYVNSFDDKNHMEDKEKSFISTFTSDFFAKEPTQENTVAPVKESTSPTPQVVHPSGEIKPDSDAPLVKPDPTLPTREKLFIALENNSVNYGKFVLRWLSSGREIISGGIAWIIGAVLIPIFVFVFLKESASIEEKWTDILPIRASRFKQEVVETLTEINGYLIAFFRGQMIVSLIDGLLIGLALHFIMGMPYAALIGAAVGVLGIVPYVGILSVYLPTLLVAWATWHNWQDLAWVSVIFLACNQFDSWIIQPKIVGNAVGLHEVTVIFSVIFWSFIFGGVVGALLAVPLTASVKVIFQRYIWQSIKINQIKRKEPPTDCPTGLASPS